MTATTLPNVSALPILQSRRLGEIAESLALYGFTVEQYHRMVDAGIMPEGSGVELLGGLLVRKDRGGTYRITQSAGAGQMIRLNLGHGEFLDLSASDLLPK